MIKKIILSLVISLNGMFVSAHAETTDKDNTMLNFLLGEIAVQRNDLVVASKYLDKITQNQKIPYVLRQQFSLAYASDDYVKALSYIGQILQDEPDNIEALLFESIIYVRLNAYDKAATVMNKIAHMHHDATKDNGFHFIYRELKGQIDPKTFLEIYEKIAQMNNYSVAVTPLLASLLVDNGHYKQAIDHLNTVIAKDDTSAVNYSLLMYAYTLSNEPDTGLQILKEASEKSSDLGIQLEYLQAMVNEFYFTDALKYAEKLAKKHPSNPQVYSHIAFLNFALRNNDVAKNSIEKIIANKGDYVSVVFKLADFARTTGRLGELYDVVPSVNVVDVQVVRLLAEGDLSLRKKAYGTFFAIFDELRSRFPDRVEYLYNQQLDMLEKSYDYQLLLPYAEILDVMTNNELFIYTYYKSMAYQETKQFDKLHELMQSWINKYPNDSLALNGYGYVLLESAKTAEQQKYAMQFLKKAIEISPDEPAIMDSIGWGFFKEKNYSEARKYLWPAYNRLKQPDVIAHYIALLVEEGKISEAQDLFQRLDAVYPDHPETLQLVERYQGILD